VAKTAVVVGFIDTNWWLFGFWAS